jgi:glyoxylase-like metal-dependent hydrolase (beta-lactamase superfamily II)
MIIHRLEAGPLATNCYIIGDEATRDAAVIDPGGDVPLILAALQEERLTCKTIFNTHTHFDHIGGNAELKAKTGAEIVTHREEAKQLSHAGSAAAMFGMRVPDSPPADRLVAEGDELAVGNLRGKIIELPGHSPAGLAVLFPGHAFVGDALFAGSIGRTDFPGGSFPLLISNIREKLFVLPDKTIVWPGHGPDTTIGQEKRYNPFFV